MSTTTATHAKLIEAMLYKARHGNDWAHRHATAWLCPQPREATIVNLIRSIADYADQHQKAYFSKVGDDGVLGPLWFDMVKSVRGLLNGDCARLDCVTLDGLLLSMASREGFTESDF